MTGRGERLLLLLLAALLCLPLFWKGHGAPPPRETVAFLRYSSPAVLVRLAGDVPAPGVHKYSDGVTVRSVMKMTVADCIPAVEDLRLLDEPLRSGDILEISCADGKHTVIVKKSMRATERILFGIPLHPDELDRADWESLPGIGPALAARIVADRQENGDYGAIERVLRVPGMGEKKLQIIKENFYK